MDFEQFYRICDSIIPDEYGCHVYLGPGPRINGRGFAPTRAVLARKLGRPIKPGYFACHHCDYPPCINPDHLYEGTPSDNQRDRWERNPPPLDHTRTPEHRERAKQWGKSHLGSKLTQEHREKIKQSIKAHWAKPGVKERNLQQLKAFQQIGSQASRAVMKAHWERYRSESGSKNSVTGKKQDMRGGAIHRKMTNATS
jgi:hypothetical protein